MNRNPKNLPIAGCVVLSRGSLVLAVGRKDGSGRFSFPGGKMEEQDASAAAAAARETFEETGTVVGGLRLLHEGDDGHGYWVHTFHAMQFSGEPRDMGQGEVKWIAPDALLKSGAFSEYNRLVFAAWRKMMLGV